MAFAQIENLRNPRS